MYLVVIVPPEGVNGGPSPIQDLSEAVEKVFAEWGIEVQIAVVKDG